jgi:type II secretory pathway component PulF
MTRFVYRAAQLTGGPGAGVVEGRESAPDERSLRDRLRDRGYVALEVRAASPLDRIRAGARKATIRESDRAWFFRTLHRLLDGGAPLERAMSTMIELSDTASVRDACERVRSSLRGGAALDAAIGEEPGLAAAQHLALLRIGHESGRMRHCVGLIDGAIVRQRKLRRALIGRLMYPVILGVAALLALWFLSAVVMPRFEETLASADASLPIQTRMTFAIAGVLFWVVPAAVLAAVTLALLGRSGMLPRTWSQRATVVFDRLPLLGSIRWSHRSALVADTMATMLEGGADLVSSLHECETVVAGTPVADRLSRVRRRVREGEDIGDAIEDEQVFPKMVTAIIRAGSHGGALAEAFRSAADTASEAQDDLTQRALTLLDPAIIIMLAGVVGWIVFSLVSGMLAINDLGGL